MSLANLFNVPKTREDWASWAFSHADHHRQIIRAIASQKKVRLAEYALDPIPFHQLDGWVWTHQQMHNDMNAVLKAGGFDLTGLDAEDQGQVAAWIRLHATEHFTDAASLGI